MNFACDRCAKRFSLADGEVPATGFQATCSGCGHVFVVSPPPPPSPLSPGASASRHPVEDEHEHFFRSAPAPGEPSLSGEWVVPAGRRRPGTLALLAVGALVVVGLAAAVTWRAGRREAGGGAASGGEPSPGSIGGRAEQAPRAVTAAPPPGGAAEAPPGGPPQRGGAAVPAAGSRGASRPGTAPGGKRDRKLLDLLDRKEDAALASAPAAGELSTGRASLDEATLRGALAANSGAFSACIAKAAKADPGLRLQTRPVVLELVVEPSGRVSRASVEDPRHATTPLGACFTAAARRMVFPSFEGEEILVQAPLKLSAVQ